MQEFLAIAGLIGSLALVGITIWYAWQTQQMVREMRAGRRSSIRPRLKLHTQSFGRNVLTKIENVGAGPALDISCEVTATMSDGTAPQIVRWNSPILRSGEGQLLDFPLDAVSDSMSLDTLHERGCVLGIEGSCMDTDGARHHVAGELKFLQSADRGPQVTVTGVDDQWPRNIECIAKELGRIGDSIDLLRREA